jgi:hypothetical protein
MSKMPRVPPANQSPKGPRSGSDPKADQGHSVSETEQAKRNQAEQGQQGNIKQNTTNQGYQQDR